MVSAKKPNRWASSFFRPRNTTAKASSSARDEIQERREDEVVRHLTALITLACSPERQVRFKHLKPRSITSSASSACV